LFSKLPDSEAKGFKPGRFSFNVKEGSCSECGGMGMIKIDMDFMEDSWIDCPECGGQRFDSDTLSVLYKGKTIHDILEMDGEEALQFFQAIPSIRKKLETLNEVGLGYLKLGQSSTTLSGGEAQRIKLAKELSRPSTGKTLYILDEPTTGLHFHDVKHLIEILQSLVDKGNSVVVIEHNIDVIKVADHLIDLGPEGGSGGGTIVGVGTPEKIATLNTPTAQAIREVLNPPPFIFKKPDTSAAKPVRLEVEAAEQNNLKRVSLSLPRDQTIVFTGPSGSGKSSLAFETFYAEGQRRYIESLSPYARQFVKQMPKPIVGRVEGLSPAIAIEQKGHAGNPRSTVGTLTEVYDYLRLLWAHEGIPHDPVTGEAIRSITKDYVVDKLLELPHKTRLQILAPLRFKKGETFEKLITHLAQQGFVRIRLNGSFYELDDKGSIPYDPKRKNEIALVIDRLVMGPNEKGRLFEAVEKAAEIGKGCLMAVTDEAEQFFNLSFTAEKSGTSFQAITPDLFAFNKKEGMCPDCQGIGEVYGANLASNDAFLALSPFTILRHLWDESPDSEAFSLFINIMIKQGIDPHTPLCDLPKASLDFVLYGAPHPEKGRLKLRWIGFNAAIELAGRKGRWELRQSLLPLLNERLCDTCSGDRIAPLARHVTLQGLTLPQFCRLPISEALTFIQNLPLSPNKKVLKEIQDEICQKLTFLYDVGLTYMQLERKAPTLSGGEAQRIRLARQLGSGLTGVLYVLDEPTVGLHPYDNEKLNSALAKLKALGNTLLLVEHDPMTIKTADYIVDFGPGAGDQGGKITAQGTYEEIVRNPHSLTGRYLSGELKMPIPKKRRPLDLKLKVEKGCCHNLHNFACDFPVSALTVLTGVSGSGKSTLMHDILIPAVKKGLLKEDRVETATGIVSGIDAFERLIILDQNPIGQTIRSDVSSYADVLTPLREFFSQLPAARAKGLEPKHFSANHRRGMCTHCWGLGFKRIEMHFLPAVKVVCEACHGLRLNPVSLEVKYEGKSLGDYFNVTVQEAFETFHAHPRIKRILSTLIDVGLGYLKLGQEIQTLSGGEAQRIKLSRELAKRSHGKTLYLLDEPTTGLHPDDIKKLMHVLNRLVDKGNTLILIEHNLDVIEQADYLIDLGPGAGADGGTLMAAGRPEAVARNKKSRTGKYLFAD
jgi:excinuclease ABC subunit A